MRSVRHRSSVTSLSWIPSEAIEGIIRIPPAAGMAHHDQSPPEQIEDLEALRDADRSRFPNLLEAWTETDAKGDSGYSGGGMIGRTKYGPGVLLGRRAHRESGKRTSTLVAVTACRGGRVKAELLKSEALREPSKDRRRETRLAKKPARN